MNIIERNFFRLLRAGVFQQEEKIEPMSAWKWRQLHSTAKANGLETLLYDGVSSCRNQFFMQLPAHLDEEWHTATTQAAQQHQMATNEAAELLATLGMLQMRPILLESWAVRGLYPHPEHSSIGRIVVLFPFATQGRKADEWAATNGSNLDDSHKHVLTYRWKNLQVEHRHRMFLLSNKLNNATLQNILEQEWLEGGTDHVTLGGQRSETVAPTLTMFITLLSIVKATISDGLSLQQILDLGILLRQQGHRVDFVKLQEWIDRLHMGRMAQHIGLILTGLLGFSIDETPFMQPETADADSLAQELLHENARPGKYIRFLPGEGIASVVSSITRSLGKVEE